jgi:hypothetical protein
VCVAYNGSITDFVELLTSEEAEAEHRDRAREGAGGGGGAGNGGGGGEQESWLGQQRHNQPVGGAGGYQHSYDSKAQ